MDALIQFKRTGSSSSSLLGYGGFSRVLRQHNPIDNRHYAIKEIPIDVKDMEKVAMVLNEVRILARLSHPHVIRYHHAWVEQRIPSEDEPPPSDTDEVSDDEDETIQRLPSACFKMCIQMELCETNLQEYMQIRNTVVKNECRDLFTQILDGVGYLHDHGIVHNDLKPGNIMLRRRRDHGGWMACIGDFGLSLCINESPLKAEVRQGLGDDFVQEVLLEAGTELYCCSENHCVDPARDIFSLGIILFELFCYFYTGMERIVTLSQLRKTRIPPPFFEEENPLESMMIRSMLSRQNSTIASLRSVLTPHPNCHVVMCRDLVWEIICSTCDRLATVSPSGSVDLQPQA